MTDFRPVTELCQFPAEAGEGADFSIETQQALDQRRRTCDNYVQQFVSRLSSFCQFIAGPPPAEGSTDFNSYFEWNTGESQEFCRMAFVPVSGGRRMLVTGSLHDVPVQPTTFYLPEDYDDIPDPITESMEEEMPNAEAVYTAIMDGEDPSLAEVDGDRRWSIRLFGAVNLGSIDTRLEAGGEPLSVTETREPTSYSVQVGTGVIAGYEIPLVDSASLLLSGGPEYFVNVSGDGANLNLLDFRLGLGILMKPLEMFDFTLSLIGRAGYQWSDGVVFHPNTGEARISGVEAAGGAGLSWLWNLDESWFVDLGIEGFYVFTRAKANGVDIGSFPIPFYAYLSAGARL